MKRQGHKKGDSIDQSTKEAGEALSSIRYSLRSEPAEESRKKAAGSSLKDTPRGLKRAHHGEEEEEGDTKSVSVLDRTRAERKRNREKERRGNVNKGLDDLMELLVKIDPGLKRKAIKERATWERVGAEEPETGHQQAPMSRVDIVQNALSTLERIHSENERHKAMIANLERRLGDAGLQPGHPGREAGPYQPATRPAAPLSFQQHGLSPQLAQQRPFFLPQSFDQGRAFPPPDRVDLAMPYGGGIPTFGGHLPPMSPMFAQPPHFTSSDMGAAPFSPSYGRDAVSSYQGFLGRRIGPSGPAFPSFYYGSPETPQLSPSRPVPAEARHVSIAGVASKDIADSSSLSRLGGHSPSWDQEVKPSVTEDHHDHHDRETSNDHGKT